MNSTINITSLKNHFTLFLVTSVLLISSATFGQGVSLGILDANGTAITGSTATFCGSDDIELESTIAASSTVSLTWTVSKTTSSPGSGSLSIVNNSGNSTNVELQPTVSGVDSYTVTLSDGTNTVSTTIVIGPTPSFTGLNIPSDLCENGGFQSITNNLSSSQSLSFSAGLMGTSGSSVSLNPAGIADGTKVYVTLTEDYPIPGSSNTFSCDAIDSLIVRTAPNPSFTLTSSSFKKCSSPVTLPQGSPAGGTYSVPGYPNAINSSGQLDPSELPEGTHTLVYTVSNTYGCSNSTSQQFSITGFDLISAYDLIVTPIPVPTSGVPYIQPTLSNGTLTYSACSGGTSATFGVNFSQSLSYFQSYSINWGDGTSVSTGTVSTSTSVNHQYNTAGIYTAQVQLTTSGGCTLDTSFNFYFGASAQLGVQSLGATKACLTSSTDTFVVETKILNWENDPSGIVYSFSSNDGGSTKTATSPLVINGISQYPLFLSYNSTTNTLVYRHIFNSNSCGALSPLAGNNVFYIAITKTPPCPNSSTNALIDPIVISNAPDAQIDSSQSVCADEEFTIYDNSNNGSMVVGSTSNPPVYSCDTSSNGYWEVLDMNDNVIPSNSGVYTLSSGSTLGNYGANWFFNTPTQWNIGSSNLTLRFNVAGTYQIVKRIGLTGGDGINNIPNYGNDETLCRISSDTVTICVDTIPIAQLANVLPDTICLGDNLDYSFVEDSINCDSASTYSLYVNLINGTNNPIFTNSSQTDTSFTFTPNSTGIFELIGVTSNTCGADSLVDTLYVIDEPDVAFEPLGNVICKDSLIISFGVSPFRVIWNDPFSAPDSVDYWITPANQNGWTLLGTNQFGHDSIVVWDSKNYTIHATATNQCGSINVNANFQLDSLPNPNFSLQDTSACDSLQPIISNVYNGTGYTHEWNVYTGTDSLVDTYTNPFPTFVTYYGSISTIYTIVHIVTTPNGCTDTAELKFFINPSPLAAFNVDTAACAPWTPNITDSSQGNNLTYNWYINANGTFASLATLTGNTTNSPALSFTDLQWPNNNQQYLLSLTVNSDSGCTNADTVDLTLYSRPKAGFQLPTDSCGPFTLTPNDTSKTHNNITQWLWRLSGPNGTTTSTSNTPIFNLPQSFNGNHNYTLTLTVTDNNGCQDSTTENFQVFPTPTAAFTLQDTTCTGTNINTILTNNSSANDNSNNQLSYNWTIDSLGINVHTTTDSIPNYTLTNNDTTVIYYTVTLTVTNNNGCDSTVFDTIYLAPNAIAQLDTLATLTDCAPFTIDTSVIKANHFSGNNNYTWNIFTTNGNPVTSFNGRNSLNYTITDDDTSFVVQLIVTSEYGCLNDTVNITVSTIENPNPYWSLVTNQGCAPFTPDIDSLAADATLTHSWIITSSTGTILYNLSGTNPTWPALNNNSYTANQAYTIKHIVQAGTGCKDSLELTVNVLPTPLAAFNVDTAACAPWTPNITDSSQGNNLTYNWYINANGTFASLATLTGNTTNSPALSFTDLQWPNNNQQYLLSLTVNSDSGCTNADTVDLTLYSRPKAGFQLPTDSCGPFTLTPNDTSKTHNNITQWLWRLSGPNGTTTSTSNTPIFNLPQSFNGNHNYTLTLTVTDNNGCQDSTTENFQVFPTPTAAFTLQDTTCTGTNINTILTNNSSANDNSNNQLSYNWTIDSLGINVHTTTDSIPNYTLTNNDTTVIYYTVTLTVTNNNGCDSTVFDTIYLAPNAIAQLDTLATLTDCAPFTIDTSVIKANHFSGNNNYTWNIFTTNGNPVTSFNGRNSLNYTITDDDTSFVVQLIVTSEYGCLNDTVNITVSTIENPNPYWSLVTNQGCAPFTPDIDSLAADATLTHSWIITSSTGTILYNLSGTNPTWPALNNNSYTANQAYTIKHIVQAGTGCKDSLELTVNVLPTPLAAFNVDTAACAPWTPNITDSSQGNNLTYNWYINANGTFASLATLTGNTTNSPALSFTDLQWPNNNQQYLLSLTVNSDSGCTNADTVDLTLYSRPKAGFQLPTDSCGPFTLTPNDTSKTHNNITQWLWRLSGPNGTTTSTSNTPIFNLPQSFNGNHNYTLTLTVTDNNGCQDSTTENFQVFPTPTAAFTLQDTTCTGTNINTILTNNSSANDNSNNQLSYNWTIDSLGINVHTTTDSIPNYTLTNNDTTVIYYTVTLTVTNNNGCDSTVFDTIYLAPNAIAQLDTLATLTDCAPFTIDTSVIKANHFSGNNNYTWNIFTTNGNPVTSFNGRNSLNYTITDDDTSFVVQLIVTSEYGCLNDTVNITVSTIENPNPYWSLVTNQGCAPFTPDIDSLAADATLTHSWIITSSTGTILYNLSGTNPTWPALNNNSYTANQAYTIKHIVQAGTGCKDSLELTVNVLPTPLAAFNVDTAACAPWTPNITDSSQGNNLTYNWYINANGTFASLATLTGNTTNSPALSFTDLQWPNNNQQYLLSLTVNSDSGCTNADTVDLTLYSRPKAGFQLPTDSCGPFTLTPNDTSKTHNNITQWLWRLSGPNGTTTSTSNTPIFNLPQSFNGNHNYTLTLTVTDNNGCQDSTTENFQVFPTPTAAFTLQDTTCTGTNINTILTNNSSANDNSNNQLSYNWTIDSLGINVHTTTDSIPNYTLTNNDTTVIYYTVTLTVTNNNGCDSTVFDTIYLAPNAIAQLDTLATLTDCAPFTIDTSVIKANHFSGNNNYTWNIFTTNGNPVTSFNGRNSLNYTITDDDTSFVVQLIVTSEYGCLNDTVNITVSTIENPNPYWSLVTNQGCAPFTPDIDSLAADATLTHSWIITSSTGTILYNLSGTNPTWPALNNNSYTANQAYTIKHIVQAGTGCKDSLELTVNVLPTPLAAFNVDTAACAPWTPNITDSSQGNNLTYNWYINANGTFASLATLTGNTTNSPALSFTDLQWPNNNQQYLLSLTVNSDSGCTNADTVDLTLYSRPKAGFQLPTDSCGPFTLTPNDTSKTHNNITQWLWRLSGPNGTTTSTSNTPIFNLPQSFNGNHNYTLTLTVTDNNGCQDSTTENFQVFPTPTAAFTLQDTTCTGTNINTILTNNSSANDNSNNQLSYNWTIDSLGINVHTTTDSIPNYTLTNNDTTVIYYTVTLTVTNNNGCDSTVFDTIYLAPNAIAQLDTLATLTDCAPFTIDTSVIKANHFSGNNNYTWNIFTTNGNPVTSFNGRNSLNYTITDDDTSFVVQLIVTSEYGCLNDTVNITVSTIENPNPYWSLVTNQGCAPFTPDIDSLAADATLTHSWIITSSTGTILYNLSGTNPTWPALNNNSYTANQAYTIKHIVQAGTGCKDSLELTVNVLPTPLAAFNVDTAACAPWTPNITDSSQGNNLTYNWYINANGTFASLATLTGNTTNSPALSFTDLQWPNNNQQYLLSLTVNSDSGCTNADTVDLTLYSRPKAGFQLPTDSCGPFTLTPNDTSKTHNNITQWLWRLSGPNGTTTSTSNTPIFNLPQSFNGNHNYTLTLTVTDNNGCQDSTTENFQVFPTPTAAFTLQDTTCTGTNINTILTNNSSANDNSNNQLSYNWTIDSLGINVHTTTDSIPNYTLTNNDTTVIYYTVTLTVTNNNGCDSTVFDTIYLAPNAIAQLDTLATLTDCAPFTIDTSVIKANHFSGNNNYTWNIFTTNGNPVTSFNGRNSLNYTISNSEDSVWVVLEVTSLYGCLSASDSLLIYTLPNPNPYFTLVSDTGCTAFNPILDSIGQNGGLHVWEVFDSSNNQIGNTLIGNSPTLPTLLNANTSALATYSIVHTVFASDSSSCDSSYTQNVYVLPLAIPIIDTIGTFCGFDTIPLSGTSTNNLNVGQWTWVIGTDTLFGQNINYYNSTPGIYTVSLTTTTLAGCDTTVYDTLTIHSYPVADISITDCGVDTVCVNQSFNFFDNSSTMTYGGNITDWEWDFDDDGSVDYVTQNGSHTYASTGMKTLRLKVTTEYGCEDDTLINIYVNAPPLNTFEITDSALCGPTTFNVFESDTGIVDSSYYELYAYNGGTKVVIQSWNSLPSPLPTLQPNYIADTVYYMSREIFNCCGSDYVEDSIIIRTPPVADFVILPDSGCSPLNVIIQLDGFVRGQADSVFVDFGDGTSTVIGKTLVTSGGQSIYLFGQLTHTFTNTTANPVTYYVSVTAKNDCGDSTLTLPVYVEPNTVQAAFQLDKSSGCAPLEVNFTDLSFNATNVSWCFDWDVTTNSCNGAGSSVNNPTFTFTQSGTYTVAFLVNNGCSYDTAYQSVTVLPSPTAIISAQNNVCRNLPVSFASNSTTPSGFIAGTVWDFGDGNSSTLPTVNHQYAAAGTYVVSLTVTNSIGCSDIAYDTITIQPTPLANFTANDVCLNDTTYFNNLSTISSGTIVGVSWDFGDGNTSNLFSPTHVYQSAGTYTVNLILTSDYGCIDSMSQVVLVFDLPQLAFTPTMIAGDSCSVPQTYSFNNSSSNTVQYTWDFDYINNPGVYTSALTNPTFTFNSPGIYTVALFAESPFGCVDSLFRNILVRDGVTAVASINPIDGCEPLEVFFTDSSNYTPQLDTIQSVEWFFGDGTSILQNSPPFTYSHLYQNYGTYSVFSVVTMTSGCSDTSGITNINVYPTPVADFNINRVNINTRLFQNLTSFVDSSITYSWTFSDGQTSNEESPTMTFEPSTTGLDSIEACLTVTNSFGCTDSICRKFWVWPTSLVVPNAFAPGLDYVGEDALFLPKGHSLQTYEIWIYDKWGELVWHSTKIDPQYLSPGEGWNGKYLGDGEDLPMGVYAWKINAVFDDGTRWNGQSNVHGLVKDYGTLTLLR